jgi:hypothetical protein
MNHALRKPRLSERRAKVEGWDGAEDVLTEAIQESSVIETCAASPPLRLAFGSPPLPHFVG